MKSRIDKALENHANGLNCAQSVACAYADLVGISEEDMRMLNAGFGLGGGCMEGTCGALSGALCVAGKAVSEKYSDLENPKAKVYSESKEIMLSFKKKNQSVICKEIKGVETGKVLQSCDGCIADAAQCLEACLDRLQSV